MQRRCRGDAEESSRAVNSSSQVANFCSSGSQTEAMYVGKAWPAASLAADYDYVVEKVFRLDVVVPAAPSVPWRVLWAFTLI